LFTNLISIKISYLMGKFYYCDKLFG